MEGSQTTETPSPVKIIRADEVATYLENMSTYLFNMQQDMLRNAASLRAADTVTDADQTTTS